MCVKTNSLLLLIIILPSRILYAETDSTQNTNSTITPIDKCFQQDSINISAPQGSDEDTIQITENRFSDYVYEIMDNTSIMLTDNSTRSCVCGLRQCIQLCSYSPHDLYNHMIENNRSTEDMQIFYIDLTLSNGTIVRRHLIHDFQTIVIKNFCDRHYSLSPELDKNSWALFENETLLRHYDETKLTGSDYCFEVDEEDDNDPSHPTRINPLNCAMKINMTSLEVANNTTMMISIPFFLLTILAYCLIPELWNIHGKCFVSYLSSITLSYSLLSCINLTGIKLVDGACFLLGFLNHYLQLAHYTWLGIICFDTWKVFSNLSSNISYGRYACFGWSMPLVWTILTIFSQFSGIPDYLKPGITAQHCGLEVNKWSATIYLYGPCLGVLVFCLYSFILTSRIIKRNDEDVYPYHSGYDGHKFRYTLYLRLFVVMGLSWFLDVVSYLCAMFKLTTSSYIMDFINAIQGLYIFFNFIGRPQVRNILKAKLVCLHRKCSYTTDSSSQIYLEKSDQFVTSELDKNLLAGFKGKLRAHLNTFLNKIS